MIAVWVGWGQAGVSILASSYYIVMASFYLSCAFVIVLVSLLWPPYVGPRVNALVSQRAQQPDVGTRLWCPCARVRGPVQMVAGRGLFFWTTLCGVCTIVVDDMRVEWPAWMLLIGYASIVGAWLVMSGVFALWLQLCRGGKSKKKLRRVLTSEELFAQHEAKAAEARTPKSIGAIARLGSKGKAVFASLGRRGMSASKLETSKEAEATMQGYKFVLNQGNPPVRPEAPPEHRADKDKMEGYSSSGTDAESTDSDMYASAGEADSANGEEMDQAIGELSRKGSGFGTPVASKSRLIGRF